LAVHGTQLLAEAPQFFALPNVLIVNRTKEVREYVLQALGHEVISSAMEELLAPNDLVLRLKAEGDGMPNRGRKRSPCLTRRGLVDVVANPGQVRQQADETLGIRGLSERVRRWGGDFIAELDKAIFTGLGSWAWASTGDECLPLVELEANTEPRHAATNRPLGNSTLAGTKAAVDNIDECGLPSLGRPSNNVDAPRLKR
jgi:hypothetical protein